LKKWGYNERKEKEIHPTRQNQSLCFLWKEMLWQALHGLPEEKQNKIQSIGLQKELA
jgi:hypothetical protein